MAAPRDKGRDQNSARKKRRAAQFGHIRTARDAHAHGEVQATEPARVETVKDPRAKQPHRGQQLRAKPAKRSAQPNRPIRDWSERGRAAQPSATSGQQGDQPQGATSDESKGSGLFGGRDATQGDEPRGSGGRDDSQGTTSSGGREGGGPRGRDAGSHAGPRDRDASGGFRRRDDAGSFNGRGAQGRDDAGSQGSRDRTEGRRGRDDQTSGRTPTGGGKQRRSLSMPRSPGRINADGPRDLAEALVASLRAPVEDDVAADSLTHPFHTYPAKLHPATARILVDIVASGARRGPLVDPFCGSGTVLVEARAAGLRALGIDLNPLATLIAHAKTWTVVARRRREFRETGHAIGAAVIAAGKEARRGGAPELPQRKPAGFDPNARDRRLASWFAPHVRRELELIAWHLDELRARDAELADVLLACLSSVLYKVSSRTSDTDETWIKRDVARGAPTRYFLQRVDLLEAGLADLPGGSPAEIYLSDARQLGEFVANGTAAGIVTSPPYAGTYDYADHQRLRFDFLALRHREFEAGEIGSRRSFRDASLPAEKAWRQALVQTLDVMAAALGSGARAAIVMGDSWAGGRAYYAIDDIRSALGGDLFVEAWASMERPMLGLGEIRAFGDRAKSEHVILLRKA